MERIFAVLDSAEFAKEPLPFFTNNCSLWQGAKKCHQKRKLGAGDGKPRPILLVIKYDFLFLPAILSIVDAPFKPLDSQIPGIKHLGLVLRGTKEMHHIPDG
jgi:hypothetical protein